MLVDVLMIMFIIGMVVMFLSLAYRIGLRNGFKEGADFAINKMQDILK